MNADEASSPSQEPVPTLSLGTQGKRPGLHLGLPSKPAGMNEILRDTVVDRLNKAYEYLDAAAYLLANGGEGYQAMRIRELADKVNQRRGRLEL